MHKSKALLPNIQILRGVAAILVAVSHLRGALIRQNLPDVLPDLTFGFFGVDLFFIISGFIMVYVAESDAGFRQAGRFLTRRITRVVPPYWLFTTIVAILILHKRRHADIGIHNALHIVTSYLFIPFPEAAGGMDIYPIYPIGWTLNYEMMFYVCFAFAMLIAPRFRIPALSTFFVGLVVLGSLVALPLPLYYWARSNILEFILGMLIAHAFLSGVKMPVGPAIVLSIAAIVGVGLFAPYSNDWDAVRGLGWGLPAAVLVASAALTRPNRANMVTRALEALGDASYSLYLLHYAFYDGVVFLFKPAIRSHDLQFRFLLPMMFFGAIIAALAFYRFIERPMTRRLQRWLVGKPSVVPAALQSLSASASSHVQQVS